MGEQSSNNILYTRPKAKVVLDKAIDHCRNAYENYHDNLLNSGYSDIAAAEACAHYYLDGKPYAKGLTPLGRSTALWSCCFWQDIPADGYAVEAVVLALGRSIHYGISEIYVLDRIIQVAPDALKRGICYSQLFLRTKSPLWLSILNNSSTTSEDFKDFLRDCDRLSEVLKTHDETVENLQSQLNELTVFEFLLYGSLFAYQNLVSEHFIETEAGTQQVNFAQEFSDALN